MIKIRRYMQYQMGGLVLLIGLVFSMGGYALMSKMAEEDAEKALRAITGESANAVDHLLQPPTTLLKLLANVPDLKTGTEKDWMIRIPAQASLLRDNKMLKSVYVGGPQGQFLGLQTLGNNSEREHFHAPPEARWLVQLQRVNAAEGEYQFWLMLDEHFNVLTRQREQSGERPMTRACGHGTRRVKKAMVCFARQYIGFIQPERTALPLPIIWGMAG